MSGHDTEKARMLAGELYLANDPQLAGERKRAKAVTALPSARAAL